MKSSSFGPNVRPSNTRYASSSNRNGRGGSRLGNNVWGRGSLNGNSEKNSTLSSLTQLPTDATSSKETYESRKLEAEIDITMGFDLYDAGPAKVGWLINMHSTVVQEGEGSDGVAAVNFYFLGEDGENFKATLKYNPYFLISCKPGLETEVEEYVRRKYDGLVKTTSRVIKDDLDMPNHITGYKKTFIQISFANVSNLLAVRRELMPLAEKNKKMLDALDVYAEVATTGMELDNDFTDFSTQNNKPSREIDITEHITDIREYDVPYHVRVSIDKDIRIGKWYTVEVLHGDVILTEMPERLTRPDPVVLAFDIETTKMPLKFPDVKIDQIMMISYMIDGNGFLITNREIVSQDIDDFEYTPKPEYEGVFTIFNEPNEKALIERFFEHVKETKPTVIVTYNGDFFDWPFVEGRATYHGINMRNEIGFQKDSEDEYKSSFCCHMDCFRWVKRDSYLPQGSQGLKAVTTTKMGYDPIELDPELMTKYAAERPQTLSEYSVSDAVATYYLYMKYVHPFIFSLCNIIPLNPDEVLRKGTGTLCEMLLMVQAYKGQIVLPNKHKEAEERFYDGHLIESETYVGGHVESLEAGVFRSDIAVDFNVDPGAVDGLLTDLDAALRFCIEVESHKKLDDVTNYNEVRQEIADKLTELKANTKRKECPLIYHLDVSSMYPNIMITNRLQPDSMIEEADCATCDFNRPGKTCDRRLPWMWRGEFFPAKKDEYNMIRRRLAMETFPGKYSGQPPRTFSDLSMSEQNSLIKKRLSDYSRKIYHKIKETKTVEKEAIVCQRENPFYADTVRDFRDRRYEYKNKHKLWKRNFDQVAQSDTAGREKAKKMIVLFDSLQLAHKCILNSFYGYVMRKGSRWYSMEMAGVTCLTGATIIQMARALVEKIGRPLELDTDGIWCVLPKSFPENFMFSMKDGKKLFISYPCAMLNHLVHARFTNHQYQTLVDQVNFKYETRSENSIFFEVDGPYRAMILPTSKEEDKNLKKRYAVFNNDGSLAELKGFEVKRRGELKLIKIFQTQIFKVFLEGSTLEECYRQVAKVSNRWLDVIDSKGATLADDELIDLICENRSMSRTLEDYGAQKSTSISTARRLAEFLGDQMVKDKGLACKYIISEKPRSAPVTERAVPVAIFAAEESVKTRFLRRWLKDTSISDFDPRDIIDWDYYRERLSSVIQKIITIPAALQKVQNPVPRVRHPDWLHKRLLLLESRQQSSLDSFKMKTVPMSNITNITQIGDLEDIMTGGNPNPMSKVRTPIAKVTSKRKNAQRASTLDDVENTFASLPAVKPSIDKNYVQWLGYMKQKWTIQRQARQHRRHLFGNSTSGHRNKAGEVSGFFRNQAEVTYGKQWQIFQVRQSETPGELKCWVMIQGSIQNVKIKVPRIIYVSSSDISSISLTVATVQKVSHILPNGNSSNQLFRVTIPEDVYIQQRQMVTGLFAHPSIEAVYEGNVDPVARFILDLGNSCQVDMTQRGVLGKGLESGFQMSSLVKSPLGSNYLSVETLKIVFLYHVISGDRQIFALFSSFDDQADIYVYEPSSRQEHQFPNMETVYQEQYRQMQERHAITNETFKVRERLHFYIDQSSNMKKIKKNLAVRLKILYSDSNNQAILAILSPRPKHIERDFTVVRDMPVLNFSPSSADSSLPALGWQLPLARRIVLHYLGLGGQIAQLLNMARYSDIPVGNLRNGDVRFVIDVQYARRLQEANVVLWWSPTPYADHGGKEKDQSMLTAENMEMPLFNNPSSYESVCVELSVKNLAINTVLTSSLINEMEGSDTANLSVTGTGALTENASLSFMENASSAPAIAVLRDLMKQWWEEAVKDNRNADVMVNNFVHWVSSAESFLYDPVLQYHVRNLSRKAFLQLLAEFRRVGSRIVFAEQDRIVIQTSKVNVGNAYAYAQYIVKSIRAKPLFNFLDIEIEQYWDYLLWMDDVNYGGFACKTVRDDDMNQYALRMYWQIKDFLPSMLGNEFSSWVEEFVEHMHGAKTADMQAMPSATPRPTQLRQPNGDDDYFGKGVITAMKKPLRKRIQQLVRRQAEASANELAAAEFEFPELPGSHLRYSNASLELVKWLCAVFGLAKDLSLEVRMMRRDLLNLFEVREFSDAGIFKNPSMSLKISQICKSCGLEADLDFCRDKNLMPTEAEKYHAWNCKHCGQEYDRLAIEERMISDVQTLTTKYQMQDLRCSKCKQIRADNLSEHCSCSGAWELTMTADDVRKKFDVYGRIAQFYGLRMLDNLMAHILGN
ncbi:hypothetical protein POJ06DRAFT_195900 [Lipomyces tetrasporus]|uniref:DNA polymerase epsilon catalytic subunit n=1 Tax=Lipomyces tetrasporus TaxID=54092 RepID=A0AAD7VSW3_9ASCO|nr:uncharacterized protein POJ06DRAFT_195900 [Lipomyces tetrasporus]KAJ8101542.1 hypothetical protein POJ06DRAFT_195900 [Lipomyces tetrasporus]